MRALIWIGLVVVSVVIEAELIAWCRPLQRWLIRRAAAALPKQHRDRYIEEWYRELEELPDAPVTRLSWVLFLVLRRGSLAKALGVSRRAGRFASALWDSDAGYWAFWGLMGAGVVIVALVDVAMNGANAKFALVAAAVLAPVTLVIIVWSVIAIRRDLREEDEKKEEEKL